MYLATASEEIRMWNFRGCDGGDNGKGLQLMQNFNPHHEQISKIVWSSDNSILGSTCKSGRSIYLTTLSGEELNSVKLEPSDPPETCLCFNSSNRFLLTGSLNGKVTIYDIKKASVKRSYTPITSGNAGKLSTTCVTFTPDNFCSVSGHQGGEIIFINIRSSQIYSPMYLSGSNIANFAGNGGSVQALRFSRFNRTILASAHSYGTVVLWNTTHRVVSSVMDIHHRGPCMDISFSPVNEMLLVSAGLDRTVRCYDVLQAKHVRCVETEHPLLCVSVARDGFSLAAGTSNGKVLLYDLRSLEKPFDILNAHSGPVSELKFDNEPFVYTKSVNSDTASSLTSSDSVRCSSMHLTGRKPLVEATNVDPLVKTSEVSSSDCKLVDEASVGENESESMNSCSLILPATSLHASNCNSFGVESSTTISKLEGFDSRQVVDISDSGDGRGSKLQKSVHFDESQVAPNKLSASPHMSPEHMLNDSFKDALDQVSDFHFTSQGSPSKSENNESISVAQGASNTATVNELSRVAAEMRGEMRRMKQEIDQQLFDWYGKMVWQLCVTENRIITHVNKLLDDRASLSEEVIKLRKENERLRKAF